MSGIDSQAVSTLPLLSIGVPVYNGERYLAQALDSALAQDYDNLEILISDNASTDSTADICQRYARADTRVRYARTCETSYVKVNLARALSMARGKYFTWLAHDDILNSPDYGRTLVSVLDGAPDIVLCASALELWHVDDPQTRTILSYPDFAVDDWPTARQALFRWPQHGWDSLVFGVFRREVLQEAVADDPYLRLLLQKLAAAGRFVVLPAALRTCRLREDSTARLLVSDKAPFELLRQGVEIKWLLFKTALRYPVPFGERVPLILETLRNFLVSHVAWAESARHRLRNLDRELKMLAAAAVERKRLLSLQDRELRTLEVAARSLGWDADEPLRPEPFEVGGIPPGGLRLKRSLNPFRRPDLAEIDLLRQLKPQVSEAQRICRDLLTMLESQDHEIKRRRDLVEGLRRKPDGRRRRCLFG